MSSQQVYASSPASIVSPNTRRKRRSKFTYKNLSTFASFATNCPLRVIAHIDLDAFYAQCETVRLGLDPSLPLAVQQWQGLIAINYPARAFGLSRHVTISEAKTKCPNIICQHVATWKEGDTEWSYSDNAFKEIATRKVSLDPYRLECRKILATIKNFLPVDKQKVEKASIDEVFLDLSAQVHGIMLERFPELKGPAPYDDPTEALPRPPTTALEWAADALVDLDAAQSEEDDPDWDDIATLIASEIVRDVRREIFEKLHYTCSAGISRNKMLAKLGSAHNKPNGQTVIRNRAVQQFLSGYKFTKIRNLGGKLGDEVVAAFNTDAVSELLPFSIAELQKTLSPDTASWLYHIIRGEDTSEVNPRTQIQSMLSAKSFRPSVNDFEVACKWLRIFVADIYSRLVEEGVLDNKRRPKTITLHHRQGQGTKSKAAPIPMGKAISIDVLFNLAKNLLSQVVVEGRAWPCGNLSLSVGGFEDGVQGNMGIGGFLVRGEQAKTINAQGGAGDQASTKRRRIGEGSIAKFLSIPSEGSKDNSTCDFEEDDESLPTYIGEAAMQPPPTRTPHSPIPPAGQNAEPERSTASSTTASEEPGTSFTCPRCCKGVQLTEQSEHEDYHFALDLSTQASTPPPTTPAAPPPRTTSPSASSSRTGALNSARGRGRGRPAKSADGERSKGQKKLAFG